MRITVNIYSYLRKYLPASEQLFRENDWNVRKGATVREILNELNLPNQVHVTVLVNNNSVDQKAILSEGDIIHILPQMGGG